MLHGKNMYIKKLLIINSRILHKIDFCLKRNVAFCHCCTVVFPPEQSRKQICVQTYFWEMMSDNT